jgi:Asp-tRNA(Asn)/Glu-tRNA(Gln) amidotransferase A subunit family amidase
MLSAMAGEDPGDPLSRPIEAAAFAALPELDPTTLRIGVSDDLGFAALDHRIRATFRERLPVIAAAVAAVEEASPRLGDADETFAVLRGAGFLSSHAEKVARAADRIGANVVANVRYAEALTLRQVVEAEAAMTRLGRDFQKIFERVDVLVAPCTAVPPFPKAEAYCTEIDGVRMSSYFQWLALTYGLTLAACPVACIPCGLDPTGAPFGLQVAGPKGSDLKVLAVAKALEAVLDGTPETRRPIPLLT